MSKGRLERRAAMTTLLADRDDDLCIVPGLGSTCWDLAAAGDNDLNFYLWGAMGGAAMIGLGLAVAQPDKRVAVITGDGEMLMGLGSLATIGIQQPSNLAVIVFDNGVYGETGMQPSHTQSGVDLLKIAEGCGFALCLDVQDEAGLAGLAWPAEKPHRHPVRPCLDRAGRPAPGCCRSGTGSSSSGASAPPWGSRLGFKALVYPGYFPAWCSGQGRNQPL